MNMKSMRIRSYRSFKVDEHVSPEAAERYRTLSAYRSLRDSGCDEAGVWYAGGILPPWCCEVTGSGLMTLEPGKSGETARPRKRGVRTSRRFVD